MRPPPEVTLSIGIIVIVTAGYVAIAAEAPPRASSFVGHTLGVAGFLAMIAGTLGYSWRKRRDGRGPMQRWLQAHVVTGLAGPYLVLLHTSFAFRGIAGVTMLVLLTVVASGLIGRFMYTSVPKPPPGYIRLRTRRMQAAVGRLTSAGIATEFAGVAVATRQNIAEHDMIVAEARAAARKRRVLALWWLLHVPVAVALFTLAIVHMLGALYYATLLR